MTCKLIYGSPDLVEKNNFENNRLTPLTVNNRRKRFCTYDIETTDWINYLMGGFYDGYKYIFCPSLDDLCRTCLQSKYSGSLIYAHYGGGFDHRFILDWVLKNRPDLMVTIIEVHGNIIALDVFTPDRKKHWRFYDSYQVIKGSLDKITQTFDVKHKKLSDTVDRANLQDNEITREYLKHDVIGLYEVLEKFYQIPLIKGVGHKMTTSSLAMSAYRQKYLDDDMPLYKLTPDKEEFVRAGYYGGRNEIFKLQAFNVREYDINSMYVSAMLNPLPYGSHGVWVKKYPLYADDMLGFVYARIRCPKKLLIPVLPYKYRGKLLFPAGEFEGVFFSKELEYAVSLGYKIVEQYKALVFPAAPILAEYAWDCWKIRQDNPGDNPLNMTAKLLGNGLYGKFAQGRDRELLTQDIDFEEACQMGYTLVLPEYNLWRVPTYSDSPAILPHISAGITAYSRICLHEYLNRYPDKVVYCDTDSVFLEDEELPRGPDLGELKLENHHKKMICLQPKFYCCESLEGKQKIRAKGFSFESNNPMPWNMKDFEKALTTKDYSKFTMTGTAKLSKLRESMRAYDLLLLVTRKRSMQTPYSKREVNKDFTTRPLDIGLIESAVNYSMFEKEEKLYKAKYKQQFKQAVKSLGGIRPSTDYDEIPRWCKRIKGRALDDIVTELGSLGFRFIDADDLYNYIWLL